MNFNIFPLDQFLASMLSTFGANSNSTFFLSFINLKLQVNTTVSRKETQIQLQPFYLIPVLTPQFSYDSSKTEFIVFIIEQLCLIHKITPLRSHPQVIRAAFDKHSLQKNNTFCREKYFSKRSDEIFVHHKSHQRWRLFSSLPAQSRSRVPGAGDHHWQRLRLSHTAWPIETRGLRNCPKNCDHCFEALITAVNHKPLHLPSLHNIGFKFFYIQTSKYQPAKSQYFSMYTFITENCRWCLLMPAILRRQHGGLGDMKITLALTNKNACDLLTCDLSFGFLHLQD